VDIDAGDALVARIKPLARKTLRPEVMGGIGGFGALCALPSGYREPVLISGTDGVGTKLKLAFEWNRHETVGQDLVAMSVNDILVQGAEPLFFLDYFACGKLNVEQAASVVAGIAQGCEYAGCALIGGETAEMPGMYADGEYDLAGFAVGVVEKSHIIDGSRIAQGDVLIGLASSGAHSNGYSLIRKVLSLTNPDLDAPFDGRTLREALLAPTRIYVRPILKWLQERPLAIKGMAHITGGGLLENVPRILPEGLCADITATRWPWPPLFQWLETAGNIDRQEMYRVFNSGIGMVLVVAPDEAAATCAHFEKAGETAFEIGHIRVRAQGEAPTVVHP
jgi:phosphoribosylformylglycinamidine cyclo-ligase